VVANAWHWFDSGAATSEVYRVLREGGRLGIVYNRRDESVEWVARLSETIDEHRGSTPQYRSGRWREGLEKTSLFGPLDRRDFAWEQTLTRNLLRDRVASISFIARLDRDDRDRVLRVVDRLAVVQFGGRPTFTMPHITEVYMTTRA
jgi:SAM-dependent methyltransferase